MQITRLYLARMDSLRAVYFNDAYYLDLLFLAKYSH